MGKVWRSEKCIRVDMDKMTLRELNELLERLNSEGDGKFVEAWFDGRGFVRATKCLAENDVNDAVDYFNAVGIQVVGDTV